MCRPCPFDSDRRTVQHHKNKRVADVFVEVKVRPTGHTTTCVNDCDYLWTGGPASSTEQAADWPAGRLASVRTDGRDEENEGEKDKDDEDDGEEDETHKGKEEDLNQDMYIGGAAL